MSTITLKELSKATRMKLRFSVPQVGGVVKGFLTATVEDLWDLPVRKLKFMAEALYQSLRSSEETLYGNVKKDAAAELSLKVLQYIIEVKTEEEQKALNAKKRSEEKQELLSLLEEQEKNDRKALTKEELLARLAEIDEE